MNFIEHQQGKEKMIEVVSEEVLIESEQDALDILANIRYLHDSSKIIIHKKNLCEDFFRLKSGLAGAVLQKFSNYRVQAAFVGDFKGYGKSMEAFMLECKRGQQLVFTPDLPGALKALA